MVKDVFLYNDGQCNTFMYMSHIQTTQDIFILLKGPAPSYLVLKFDNILPANNWVVAQSVMCKGHDLKRSRPYYQSINQSILFLIKRYIINALSAVQWNTHISLNIYIYIYSEIQHTYKHSYKAAISAADTMFLFHSHTLSHSWTLRAARAFLILGNPSLVLKSPPGVPPSMLQPRQHHSRPTLIQPLVALFSLSR